MKNLKKTTLALGIVFAVLFSLGAVSALGVTRPVPYNIEITPGSSEEFSFEIQAVTSTEDVVCKPSISGMQGLEVFLDDQIEVSAGEIKEVTGKITAQEDVAFGEYSGQLNVNCHALNSEEGSDVNTAIGGLAITANVVEQTGKVVQEEKEASTTMWLGAIIVVAILALALVVYKTEIWKKLRR